MSTTPLGAKQVTQTNDLIAAALIKFEREHVQPLIAQIGILKEANKALEEQLKSHQPAPSGQFSYSDAIKKNRPVVSSLLANVARESVEKQKIENNITISGFPETNGNKDEKEAEDKAKLTELLNKVELDLSDVKRFRRIITNKPNANHKPALLVVEFNSKNSKDTALKNSKTLREVEGFKEVYINKELTQSESAEEKRLRTERNNLNEKLPEGDGRQKYGKEGEKEFYYGIRFGEVRKIDRSTNKILKRA